MLESSQIDGPKFYAQATAAAPERAPLAQDADVDVCVIGGGLAGLSVAREVVRRGWSVAVLEAKKIAWNASGRNAGFVSPGFAEKIENIVERVGLARAKELWALSAAGAESVRTLVRNSGMAGIDPIGGWLIVRRTDAEDDLLRHVAMMRVDFGAELDAWSTEQVRDVLRSDRYYQGVHWPGAFRIHPRKYALALAAAAEAAGARIFEDTPALAIDSAGVRKLVETPNGRVRAAHVVLAGGPHLGWVFPAVAETVIAVASSIAITAPLGEALTEAVRYGGSVSDTRRGGDYYRIVAGDRLLWGSGINTRLSTPSGLAGSIRRAIRAAYPQLTGVKLEEAWSGVMSYAVHKMPLIGEVMPGVWLAAAFGGHGINTTAMAGDLIASAIVEGDDRWRLFSSYELVWTGGIAGRVATQVLFWARRLEDAVAERLARHRERGRGRAARQAAHDAQQRDRRAAEAAARRAAEQAERAAAEESAERFAAAQRAAARSARQAAQAGQADEPQRLAETAAAHNIELLRAARGAGAIESGGETPEADRPATGYDPPAPAPRTASKARGKAKRT